jgi:bleomycin hydrolase
MKLARKMVCWNLFLGLCLISATAFAGDEGGISQSTIDALRANFKLDGANRAIYNAATNNGLPALAVNREIVEKDNSLFSDKIKSKGITNQKGSERCWLFAGLNVMRPAVIEKYKLDSFEFSENYLSFWDKLEKSNTFLEFMVELSDKDYLDREYCELTKMGLSEGGWWGYVVELIDKYGAMPKEAMPESPNSDQSRALFVLLSTKLRADAVALRKMRKEGKSIEEVRAAKNEMLAGVYRILVLTLGEPPREFAWRYADKDGKPSPLVKYTPQSFYKEIVGVDLSSYVSLGNDPTQPYEKHYSLNRSRNMYNGADVHYVNVDMETLKSLTRKSLLDNQPVWFGADMGKDQKADGGIMAVGVYDYESLFGVKLGMSKADRISTRETTANHAMTFIGVDLQNDKPVKWLVENSWGKDKGRDGYWNMYDSWFDEHVFNVIVRKAYVPEKILKIFQEDPTKLPPWYPSAALLK